MYLEHHRGNDTHNIFSDLAMNLEQFGKGKIYFAYDAPEGSKRRKDIFPEYKANRKDREKKMSKVEIRQFREFKREYLAYKHILPKFGNILYLQGWEADDFANLVSQKFAGKEGVEVILVSSDRDWSMNLTAPNIKLFHWGRKLLIYNQAQVKDVFKLYTNEALEAQVFAGISKENVEGIKNFGPSRFLETVDVNTMSKSEKLMAVQKVLDLRATKAQVANNTGKWGTKLPERFNTLEEMYDFNYELLRPVVMGDLSPQEVREFVRQFQVPAATSPVHSVVGAFAEINQVYMPSFDVLNFFNITIPEYD